MHREAQSGPAAHWRYKHDEEMGLEGEVRLKWFRGLLEQREPAPDHTAFIQQLYRHVLGDRPAAFHEDGRAERVLVPATGDDV